MKTIIIDGIEYNLTPKVLFKKGDFVVIQETTYQITKVENLNVTLSLNGRECIFDMYVLKNAHLWTISDAKDGDVLSYKDEISLYRHDIKNCTKQETTFGGFVYYCCYDGKRFIVDSLYSLTEQDKMDIHPAAKEQRDTLLKAMTDAGYIFDFEKKELKKIEQKPAWSEEDEEIIHCLEYTVKHFYEDKDTINRCCNWLKSLRPCPRWKPSEEQMRALNYVVNLMASSERPTENDLYYNILKSLRQQLNKLKG